MIHHFSDSQPFSQALGIGNATRNELLDEIQFEAKHSVAVRRDIVQLDSDLIETLQRRIDGDREWMACSSFLRLRASSG